MLLVGLVGGPVVLYDGDGRWSSVGVVERWSGGVAGVLKAQGHSPQRPGCGWQSTTGTKEGGRHRWTVDPAPTHLHIGIHPTRRRKRGDRSTVIAVSF